VNYASLLEQNLARFGQHPLLPTPGQAAAGIPFRQVADYLSYPGQIPRCQLLQVRMIPARPAGLIAAAAEHGYPAADLEASWPKNQSPVPG
jgi:hypothetical protein